MLPRQLSPKFPFALAMLDRLVIVIKRILKLKIYSSGSRGGGGGGEHNLQRLCVREHIETQRRDIATYAYVHNDMGQGQV